LHTELEDYWSAFGSSDECIYCCQLREEIDTDVTSLRNAVHLRNTFKISSRTHTQHGEFSLQIPISLLFLDNSHGLLRESRETR